MKESGPYKQDSVAPPLKYRKYLWTFKIVSVLLPFAMLAFMEVCLRLFGYGHDLGLFVESKERPGFLTMNPHASERYFADQENATTGAYEEFSKLKGKSTYRIFVLGESTTIGYPYFYNGSFHRWLQYRLMHTYPDVNFEVINVSLTAVNSYTVLGFGKEVIKYEPDAIMIYTGHNEYYGAMGVGSITAIHGNRFLIRVVLKLREFRLVQLFNRSWSGLKKIFAGNKIGHREGLMKRMAEDQQIEYGSEVYQQGIRQFENNMDDLLALMNKQHVPVFISNLVSNEKDLKPFVSLPGHGPVAAMGQFQLATKACRDRDFSKAKRLFIKAKELDMLRFRAPEAINIIIGKLIKKYPGCYLADTRGIYEKSSPHGILGKETLLEHVHPNLFGYALLSDAFYRSLTGVVKFGRDSDGKREMSFEQLRNQMPITMVDSLKGAYEVSLLKEGWPFNEPIPEHAEPQRSYEGLMAKKLVLKKITWGDAMMELLDHYRQENKPEHALKVCEALALEHPYEPYFWVQSGKLGMQLGDNEKAVFCLKKAFFLKNTFETAKDLFVTLLKQDKPEEAIFYLRYAAERNTSSFSLNELISFVNEINVLKSRRVKEPENPDLANRIAAIYLKFANVEVAEKYMDTALKLNPENAHALKIKKQIQDIRKQNPVLR